eukprot:Rmarinus@m.27372
MYDKFRHTRHRSGAVNITLVFMGVNFLHLLAVLPIPLLQSPGLGSRAILLLAAKPAGWVIGLVVEACRQACEGKAESLVSDIPANTQLIQTRNASQEAFCEIYIFSRSQGVSTPELPQLFCLEFR